MVVLLIILLTTVTSSRSYYFYCSSPSTTSAFPAGALRSNPCPCTSNVLGGDGGHVLPREIALDEEKSGTQQFGTFEFYHMFFYDFVGLMFRLFVVHWMDLSHPAATCCNNILTGIHGERFSTNPAILVTVGWMAGGCPWSNTQVPLGCKWSYHHEVNIWI